MARAPVAINDIAPLLIGVQSHPERDVSLETLAAEHGYSPSHFHRLFTEAVGETPKEHVERVRLERAAYRLSVTKENILDIALSVGFQNHETFSRAFKRRFGNTPTAWRQTSAVYQKQWMETEYFVKHEGCELSTVSYLTLKPMTLLAMRRMAQYGTFGIPDFDGGPSDWSRLVDEALRRKLPFRKLGMMFCYDSPRLTPPHLQAIDACVPLLKTEGAPWKGAVRRLDFAGGLYGAIDHRGKVCTLENAYRTLAFSINKSGRFIQRDGAPLEILRQIRDRRGSDPASQRNLSASRASQIGEASPMIRTLAAAAAILLVAPANAQQSTAPGGQMPAPIVFFDIAGPDLVSQKSFYGAVLGIQTDAMGQFQSPAVGAAIPALLRTDPKETVVYFGVDSINATMEKVVANGGKVHAPRFEVKGIVILGLFYDPAGNRVGLVEMKDGKPIVP